MLYISVVLGSIIHRVEFLALADMADAVSAVALEVLCYAVLYEAAPFSFSLLVFGTIWDQCAQDVDSFLDLSLEDFHITTDIDIRRCCSHQRSHCTLLFNVSIKTLPRMYWKSKLSKGSKIDFFFFMDDWDTAKYKKEEHLPFTLGCIFQEFSLLLSLGINHRRAKKTLKIFFCIIKWPHHDKKS